MRRRNFIVGVTTSLPLRALAQSPERLRRVGVLMGLDSHDQEGHDILAAFREGLAALGWHEGRNVSIETRWAAGDAALRRSGALELVKIGCDVVLAQGTPQLAELLRQTRAVPIVFVQVPDPVGGGFVANLANPGGNATGFTSFEDSMSSKWLELLKEAQPGIRRVAIFRNPLQASGSAVLTPALQSAAHAMGVTLVFIDVQGPDDVDRAFETIASQSADGLIALPDPVMTINRRRIGELCIRHRLPSVFYYGYFAQSGGLITYGPDSTDIFSRSAEYVDRILKGASPATLPVQQPTKFELVVNLKTAKGIGLSLPSGLVSRADKVIE